MTTMVCIAGFGDNGSMFRPLLTADLANRITILPLDLPGFGKAPLQGETTLESLAQVVDTEVRALGAEVVLAHSVASIIASLAASNTDSPIRTLFSLEGNLTAEDAYFSGSAADHSSAESFRAAFLQRLDELAEDQQIVARYRVEVAKADPLALWQLGCDAHRFSEQHVPGEILVKSAETVYFYNPANLPKTSLDWLISHDVRRVCLDNATHWASVDQSAQLAEKLAVELTAAGY